MKKAILKLKNGTAKTIENLNYAYYRNSVHRSICIHDDLNALLRHRTGFSAISIASKNKFVSLVTVRVDRGTPFILFSGTEK